MSSDGLTAAGRKRSSSLARTPVPADVSCSSVIHGAYEYLLCDITFLKEKKNPITRIKTGYVREHGRRGDSVLSSTHLHNTNPTPSPIRNDACVCVRNAYREIGRFKETRLRWINRMNNVCSCRIFLHK